MVVFGDGGQQSGINEVVREAEAAKRQRIRIMAICSPTAGDCEKLRAAVSSPADYFEYDPADLTAPGTALIARLMTRRIVAATLVHDLAPAVAVTGTIAPAPPAPSAQDADGRWLRWNWAEPVPAAVTVTYALAPQVDAWRGTAVTSTLTVTDDLGVGRVVHVSTDDLEITGPCAPTATTTPHPSATPTATRVPSATATPTATPTPTPTATPIPGPIYLPLALTERCDPTQQRIDVALVLDASTSMADPTRTGRRKIDAALDAARSFLDLLALDAAGGSDAGDQAAIVAFNADAWILAPLTNDRTALDDALAAITLAPQTRLDRAVAVGAEALVDNTRRRQGNQPVLVLLTDGRANPVPIEVAVAEAAASKAAGVTVFTIGLGEDVEADGLAAMASTPAGALRAPDGEDLAAAYAAVARSIPCPAGAWWGGR